MQTRRSFLAGSASTLGLLASAIDAAGAPDGVLLQAARTNLSLGPGFGDVPGLRFGGSDPMRLLRIKAGETIRGRLENALNEPTALFWSGLRGLLPLDVADQGLIAAGTAQAFSPRPNDSGTAWFRAGPVATGQAGRGLRGVLVVEETDPPSVDEDLVVFLEDWTLDAQHALRLGDLAAADPATTTLITANGVATPLMRTAAPGSRLRLRLVNGSVGRAMLVACKGTSPKVVAIDGQPSELFEPVRATVPIGPGGRFDYLLDLPASPDAVVELTLRATERKGAVLEPERPLVSIRTAGTARASRPPIAPLARNPALPVEIRLEKSKRVDLTFEAQPGKTATAPAGWTVNGTSGTTLPKAPVLRVKRGDPVTFGLINRSAQLIPFHLHGHVVRLLHAKDDGWEPYWRDTVLLPPNSSNHVAFVADTPGRWLMQSAFDAQALGGLRCWFETAG